MVFQSQILTFILIFAFIFPQVYAFVPCVKTSRGCPDGYTCSSAGDFCKQNGKNDLRSSWSLLKSTCLDGYMCGPNNYCMEYKKKCIPKAIFACDFYLDAMKKTGCNNAFLLESFENCGNFYHTYNDLLYNYISVIQCADQCARDYISINTNLNEEDSCSLREQYAVGNYSNCYSACKACNFPTTWPTIFKNVKKWGNYGEKIGRDFAQKCCQEYLSKKGKWMVSEIKSIAQSLINSISTNLNVDTSDFFKNVMALEDETLTTPQQCPATTPCPTIFCPTTTPQQCPTTTPCPTSTTSLSTTTISPQTSSSSSHSVPFQHQKYHFWLLLVIGFTFLVIIFLAIFLFKSIKRSRFLLRRVESINQQVFRAERPNAQISFSPLPPSPNIPVSARPPAARESDSGSSRYEAARNSADEHVRFHSPIPSSIRRP